MDERSDAGTWRRSLRRCASSCSSAAAPRRRPGGADGADRRGESLAGRRSGPRCSRPATRARLVELILREAVGLGPLEEVLADPAVEEVMVNGPERVYVERAGRIERTEVRFPSEQALRDAIERILAPLGRRVDELSPMVDARLEDGSRVNVVIPPLAVDGPSLSIRRFSASRPGSRRAGRARHADPELRDELGAAVAARRSILISGGTGSGKTTLLNALSAFVEPARAGDHDRGRGRAAAAPAARRPAREPARPTSRAAAWSRSATCCATRCGCARTGS